MSQTKPHIWEFVCRTGEYAYGIGHTECEAWKTACQTDRLTNPSNLNQVTRQGYVRARQRSPVSDKYMQWQQEHEALKAKLQAIMHLTDDWTIAQHIAIQTGIDVNLLAGYWAISPARSPQNQ